MLSQRSLRTGVDYDSATPFCAPWTKHLENRPEPRQKPGGETSTAFPLIALPEVDVLPSAPDCETLPAGTQMVAILDRGAHV
jgi:hypothetical protein